MMELDDELNELEGLLEDEYVEQNDPVESSACEVSGLEVGQIEIQNFMEIDNVNELLAFDDLDIALRGQAGSFAYYSALAAKAQLQLSRAKNNVEQVEAALNYRYRNKLTESKEKFTEKSLDSMVKNTKAYSNAVNCLNDAQYIYKLIASLVEAFNQREQMIIQSCKRAEMEMHMKGGYSSKNMSREERDQAFREAMKNSSTAAD